jgi:hypothetical protein
MSVHDEFADDVARAAQELNEVGTLKSLLTIIADPKAAAERIKTLEKLLRDIETARAALAAERQAHVERVDRDMTLLSKRVA